MRVAMPPLAFANSEESQCLVGSDVLHCFMARPLLIEFNITAKIAANMTYERFCHRASRAILTTRRPALFKRNPDWYTFQNLIQTGTQAASVKNLRAVQAFANQSDDLWRSGKL